MYSGVDKIFPFLKVYNTTPKDIEVEYVYTCPTGAGRASEQTPLPYVTPDRIVPGDGLTLGVALILDAGLTLTLGVIVGLGVTLGNGVLLGVIEIETDGVLLGDATILVEDGEILIVGL